MDVNAGLSYLAAVVMLSGLADETKMVQNATPLEGVMRDNHTSPEGIMGLMLPKGPIMQPKGRRTLVRGPRAA